MYSMASITATSVTTVLNTLFLRTSSSTGTFGHIKVCQLLLMLAFHLTDFILIFNRISQDMMGLWDAMASAGTYANNLHLAPDR